MTVELRVLALTLSDIQEADSSLQWQQVHAYQDVPTVGGVYVWIAQGGAAIYIGKAAGSEGLRGRIRQEWVGTEVGFYDTQAFVSHARMASRMAAVPWIATCADPSSTERMLLDTAITLTGHVPIINGGAWRQTLG